MPVSTGRVSSLPRQVCGGRWCVAGTRGPKWPEDPTIRVTTPLKPAEPEKIKYLHDDRFCPPSMWASDRFGDGTVVGR
jgi:hypothetical protein